MVYNNALHVAAFDGCSRKVRALVEAGLDVNARRGGDNETPLYLAAYEGHTKVVRVLLEAGADTDQVSNIPNEGATPLFVSAQNGHVERALLEAGANINLTRRQAVGGTITPALCAALLGHEEVEKLLRRAPSKVCGNPDCKHTAWTASMKGEFKKCSGCLGVKYCSQSCQRVHWKEHKKACSKN